MGRVVLSPNIVKTSVRIDGRGNEINPRTKEVIRPIVEDAPANLGPAPAPVAPAPSSSLDQVIEQLAQKKAQDITKRVDDRTAEILKDLLK